jgi:hypothetical protein
MYACHVCFAGPHCAVMAILQSSREENIITTVTKLGVIVQWDLDKLSVQSFCASATPVSLRRVVLGDSPSIGMSPIVGAAFARRGYNYTTCAGSTRSGKEERSVTNLPLCVTLSSGCVLIFDLLDQKLLEYIECPLSAYSAVLPDSAAADSATVAAALPDIDDGNVTPEAPPLLHCPINFSNATGNQLFYTASPKTNHLDIMRLGGSTSLLHDLSRDHICRQQLKILQQQHLRYADAVSYLEHLRPVSITDTRGSEHERYLSQQLATMCLSSKPLMQRCSRICHTLQGHVLEASPGCSRIVTSQDLTTYLCATGHENRSGSVIGDKDEFSRNRNVSISGMLNGNKSSVLHIKMGTDMTETVCYTIDTIFGCEICLDKPYQGPPISAGTPITSLRTNLQPKAPPPSSCGTTSSSSSAAAEVIRSLRNTGATVNSRQEEPSGKCGERLAHIPLPSRATSIQPHPHCPYVVVGCLDDSVVVVSAESS